MQGKVDTSAQNVEDFEVADLNSPRTVVNFDALSRPFPSELVCLVQRSSLVRY